jgi:hypothetical protein
MMADNLLRNGFLATGYGNVVSQMHDWPPQLSICPTPLAENTDAELDTCDLAIASPSRVVDAIERLRGRSPT